MILSFPSLLSELIMQTQLAGLLSRQFEVKAMRKKINKYGYLFVLPFILSLIIFGIYPTIYTVVMSFQKWDGLSEAKWIEMENYKRLFSDHVYVLSLWNTIRIWIIEFVPQLIISLILSAWFSLRHMRGMSFFRAAFYLPNLLTAAAVGILFSLLFKGNKSVANNIFVALHVPGAPFNFFQNGIFVSNLASYIQWWMWFGYTTIIIMAGITAIDSSIYEAAQADGASRKQTYLYITLPLIKPTIIYIIVTSIIGGMQLFDVPSTLSNGTGDPDKAVLTTSMYLYNQGFKNRNFGYSAAVSVGLFGVIAAASIISFAIMNRRNRET